MEREKNIFKLGPSSTLHQHHHHMPALVTAHMESLATFPNSVLHTHPGHALVAYILYDQ